MEIKKSKESEYFYMDHAVWQLEFASVMQRKLPTHYISLHISPLFLRSQEDLHHLLFECVYAVNCWSRLFHTFNLCWVFDND